MNQPNTSSRPSGPEYLRLVLLGAAIGIPAAVLAAVLLAVIHDLSQVLWHDLPKDLGSSSPQWYLVIGLPVVGAAVVVVARRLLPGDGGKNPLIGLSHEPTPVPAVFGVVLAAIGTLAFGAVLGPEGPVIAVGSAVGMAVTLFVKLEPQAAGVLSTAGSFSSISALFDGPVVAGMMMVESGLAMGTALPMVLVPGLVAAAVGYLIFVGFGSWGGLNAPGLSVPDLPAYTGVHAGDLLIALIVGAGTTLVIAVVHGVGERVDRLQGARLSMPILLLGGGLVVGALAELADLLGANSQNVLFSGQSSIPAIVATSSTKIIVVTFVAKALAYAVSMGCGFRGGPIFPAIFLAVTVASFPVAWFHTSPTLAIAVGAAAGMCAQTRLLVTSVLFAGLLVGRAGADAIPAAVLAAVAAWLTHAVLEMRAAKPQPPQPQGRVNN